MANTEKTKWEKLGVSEKNTKNTPKLFYNKYPYKVDLYIEGASLYRYIENFKGYKSFSKYVIRRQAGVDVKKLYNIYTVCQTYKRDIRLRVERNHISICATTEEQLFDIITFAKLHKYITTVYRPNNEEAKEKIKNSIIFVKEPKHKFRVMIRGGSYTSEVRKQILAYFNNYKDTMFVSPGVIYRLEMDYDSWIQGYFHVDDTDCLLFLKMVAPQFIGKIFQLEVLSDK